jgi:hypothetical protein
MFLIILSLFTIGYCHPQMREDTQNLIKEDLMSTSKSLSINLPMLPIASKYIRPQFDVFGRPLDLRDSSSQIGVPQNIKRQPKSLEDPNIDININSSENLKKIDPSDSKVLLKLRNKKLSLRQQYVILKRTLDIIREYKRNKKAKQAWIVSSGAKNAGALPLADKQAGAESLFLKNSIFPPFNIKSQP